MSTTVPAGEEAWFVAVIGDLVKSRQLPDRADVQEVLRSTLGEINRACGDGIVSRFKITQGDEFQGLLRASDCIPKVWWTYQQKMFGRAATRFGFGLGPISTALHIEPEEMDGPCFHAAREAIDWGHQRRSNLAIRIDGNRAAGESLSRIAGLIEKTTRSWTKVQWQTVALLREHGSQAEVARRRGVTHQSVRDVLTSSLGIECLEAWEGLESLVGSFSGAWEERQLC